MQIDINVDFKFASVWLTSEEIDNQEIMDSLAPYIADFRARKFKFVIYQSGKGNLLELTKDLLKHNKNLVLKNPESS